MPAKSRAPRRTVWIALPLFALATAPVTASSSGTVGPDVTIYSLSDIGNYTSGGPIGGMRAYSVGTVSCNIGDQPLNWCDNNGGCGPLTWNQHPVIAQNLYRLKNGRFEQLGMSWLKHGFLSTNSFANDCRGANNETCVSPPLGSNQLGVGCTDPYGSGLNGSRPLGMRSEVNPSTGFFPFPETVVGTTTALDQRIVVADADLDPALNAGARWWVEGQYIADNDALADNGVNNASYREVTPSATAARGLSFVGNTIREQSAMRAWKAADALVELVDAEVVIDGVRQRFEVGRRVTEPSPGQFRYEYAIRNTTAERAARRLEIDFADGVVVSNIGFKDVDHHSGEYEPDGGQPIETTDWTSDFDAGTSTVAWETETYGTAPEANALRWGTMYNFWFDADASPDQIEVHTLRLFKPGTPDHVDFWSNVVFFGLDVTLSGNGSVTSDPAGISCPGLACSHAFAEDTLVELTATAATGQEFVGWSGDCSGSGTCQVTMSEARAVTATFVPLEWTLDVTVDGPGSVTSTPAGIACPGDCSEVFEDGTEVTLEANPDPGAHLIAWSGGGCSGVGTCELTIQGGVSVTATFDTMPFLDGFESGDTSQWSSTTTP
jgi:hypothetical protein